MDMEPEVGGDRSMSMESPTTGYRKVLRGMVSIYLLIFLWEIMTTPVTSHSNSWQGVPLSLFALPTGAFALAKHPGTTSRFFLYGVGGSVLFVFRFVYMDRFSLWLQYEAPSAGVIIVWWIVFALGMGLICCCAAKLRQWADSPCGDA